MLVNVLLVCAALGGTLLVGQLVAGLLGLGGAHGDHDALPCAGEHASPGLGLLGLRAVGAALGFFGLGGLAALSSGLRAPAALLLGLGAGGGGVMLVRALHRVLPRLAADGTIQLRDAVGRSGTVYLGIPGHQQGAGKVTLSLQGRTVECEAVTFQQALPAGSRVLIVDVVGPGRVAVELDPAPEVHDKG